MMQKQLVVGIVGLTLIGGLSVAAAQTMDAKQIRLTSNEIAALSSEPPSAGTSGIATISMSVLQGDPNLRGPYTIALTVPPHTLIRPHTHKDARSAVVVRGTWYFAYGPKMDVGLVKKLGPGSFYTEPAGAAHFARTGKNGAVLYISGWGPSDTIYVD